MAILKLHFEHLRYQAMLDQEISSTNFLDEILKEHGIPGDVDDGTFGEIIGYLMDLHSGEGGSYEIDDFEVVESDYNFDTKIGKVEISYWIYYFFGCSDLNSETDDYETWRFEINVDEQILYLDIPQYEKRSTFEEF